MNPTGLAPDGVLAFVLLDVTLILIAARVVGALARRVGQPTVVGEIVAGVLLGPTLLGPAVFVWSKPWSYLECEQALAVLPAAMRTPSVTACIFPPQARSVLGIIGQIALVLFMFLVGLELDFSLLKGKGRSILTVALGAVLVPIALGFAIAPTLYNSRFVAMFGTPSQPSMASFTLMVGAMLSVTAFPVMARILQEKRLTQTAMGSVGIAAAAVVTVLMFLTVAVAAGVATDQGPSDLSLKFLLAAGYIAALFLVVRPALVPIGRAYDATGSVTPGIFATIIIILFSSAYIAHKLGINVIVGGFLAGAVLPARRALFREMATRLADFTAIILLPIFLAFSGLNTDFTKLGVSVIPGISLFILAGIVGKWVGGAVFARLGGLSWAEGNVIGVLMNCRGLLVLVVALIAFNQNVISSPLQAGGVLMALITTAMTGPLFDASIRRVPNAHPSAPGDGVPAAEPRKAFRVLAALADRERGPTVAHAAFALIGDRRPAEVVLVRLLPLPHDQLLSGVNDEPIQAERAMRTLRVLASFAPEEVSVTPIAASSSDVAADLVQIVEDRRCDMLVLERGGAPLALLQRLLRESACDVIVYSESGASDGPAEGPVHVATVRSGPAAVVDQIQRALGRPVKHIQGPVGSVDLLEVSTRSSAILVVICGREPASGELVAGIDTTFFDRSLCPVYIVRPKEAMGEAEGAT